MTLTYSTHVRQFFSYLLLILLLLFSPCLPSSTKPTPSQGGTILHADEIAITGGSTHGSNQFYSGEPIYWKVKVLDQDGYPVPKATLTVEIVDSAGNIASTIPSLSDSDEFGWAIFKFTPPPNMTGPFTLKVKALDLYSEPGSIHESSADANPVEFTILP